MKKSPEELLEARNAFAEVMAIAKVVPIEAVRIVRGKFSLQDYVQVEAIAKNTGLEGIPYIHFADFNTWIHRGYCVQKGQKAVCSVPTIKTFNDKETGESKRVPWTSYLFHISQVKEL